MGVSDIWRVRFCIHSIFDNRYLTVEEAKAAVGDGVEIVWNRDENAMLRLDIVDDVVARAQQISAIVASQFAAETGAATLTGASPEPHPPAAAAAAAAAAAPAATAAAPQDNADAVVVVVTHGDLCNAFSSPSAIVPDIGQFRFDYTGWVLQEGWSRPYVRPLHTTHNVLNDPPKHETQPYLECNQYEKSKKPVCFFD